MAYSQNYSNSQNQNSGNGNAGNESQRDWRLDDNQICRYFKLKNGEKDPTTHKRQLLETKVIDFRDHLIPAFPQHYAMLHGSGGKDHAPISGIYIYITHSIYAPQDKAGSSTCKALVSTTLFEAIKAVCEQNIGLRPLTPKEYAALPDRAAVQPAMPADFTFTRQSINPWDLRDAEDVNGRRIQIGKVTELVITRRTIGGRENSDATYVSKNPWFISISNYMGHAVPGDKKGTYSYNPRTQLKAEYPKTSVNYVLTDMEMHAACCAIERYVRVWENAICINLVGNAYKDKMEAYEQRRNANNGQGNAPQSARNGRQNGQGAPAGNGAGYRNNGQPRQQQNTQQPVYNAPAAGNGGNGYSNGYQNRGPVPQQGDFAPPDDYFDGYDDYGYGDVY